MDKKPGVPHIKTKGVHIIGEQDKKIREIAVEEVEKHLQKFGAGLNQIIENIMGTVDGIEHRVSVVEEVKQIVPSKIEVIVKHEDTNKKTKKD